MRSCATSILLQMRTPRALWLPFTRIAVRQPKLPPPNESDRRRYGRRLLHFQLALAGETVCERIARVRLILSFMSVAELRMGEMSAGWASNRRLPLERFVQGFELSYPDNDLCTVWARIRADARASGRAISPQDAWIASAALALDAPLATNNCRDFENVRNLRLLSL